MDNLCHTLVGAALAGTEARDGYALGSVDWLHRPHFTPGDPPFIRKNEDPGIVRQVTATRPGRIFLHWARFPFYRVEPEPDGRARVSIMDARYALRPGRGIGSLVVEVGGRPETRAPG